MGDVTKLNTFVVPAGQELYYELDAFSDCFCAGGELYTRTLLRSSRRGGPLGWLRSIAERHGVDMWTIELEYGWAMRVALEEQQVYRNLLLEAYTDSRFTV